LKYDDAARKAAGYLALQLFLWSDQCDRWHPASQYLVFPQPLPAKKTMSGKPSQKGLKNSTYTSSVLHWDFRTNCIGIS